MTMDRTIQVDGLTIRYRDTGGDGVPVLLSSGIGGSLELWQKQLDALGGQHRLIAWDYPGHGLSDPWRQTFEPGGLAAFTLKLLDALGVGRAVLAGNSLGGAIAIRVAAAAPARVAGLVLAAPAMVVPEIFLPFRLMTLPLLGPLMTKPSEKGVALALASMFHNTETVTDDIRAVMRRNQFKEAGRRPSAPRCAKRCRCAVSNPPSGNPCRRCWRICGARCCISTAARTRFCRWPRPSPSRR